MREWCGVSEKENENDFAFQADDGVLYTCAHLYTGSRVSKCVLVGTHPSNPSNPSITLQIPAGNASLFLLLSSRL